MKKTLISILAILFLLVACGKRASHELKVVEIIEKFENKDSFIFYVGSKNCKACQVFTPTFTEVAAEYPEYLFSIELISARNNQKADFDKLEDLYINQVAVTPSIYYVKDGKVVDSHFGVLKYSDLEHILNVYEIMK